MNPDGSGIVPDEPYWLEESPPEDFPQDPDWLDHAPPTQPGDIESFVCEESGTLEVFHGDRAGEGWWMEAAEDSWEVPEP